MGPFPQVFGQVKQWLMLELHETIRVSHVVLCPIVFILFYDDQDWHNAQAYERSSVLNISRRLDRLESGIC